MHSEPHARLVDSSTKTTAVMTQQRCEFGKRSRLICMLILTFIYFLTEIVVGYVTNSVALVADSFHMLSDAISLLVGLTAVIYTDKTSKHNTYGWVRAEVLGAFFNAVFLLALCFNIVIEAIQRLVEVEEIESPLLVLGVGAAGLVINIAGLFLFHNHSHGHAGHSHGHHQDENSGSHLNMRGVFLHVLGDALGSVVVIANALVIYFVQDDWKYYLDPVMSIIISVIIVSTTIPLLKQSSMILLQNPPGNVKLDEIVDQIEKISGVVSIHDLHIWQLSEERVVASLHIVMHLEGDFSNTAHQVNKLFHDCGIHSLTLQPEICRNCTSTNTNVDSSSSSQTGMTQTVECDLSVLGDDGADQIRQRNKANHQSCLLPCVTQECKRFHCCKQLQFKDHPTGQSNQSFC